MSALVSCRRAVSRNAALRTRRTGRRTLLSVVGAAVLVMASTIPFANTATTAAQLHSLTAGNFHEVALQGFGDPLNSWAWSMGWFGDKLYVGTNRDQWCVEWASAALHNSANIYPPAPDPDLAVPCDPDPQALPVAAEIWALDPHGTAPLTQTNWTEVYQSPYTVSVNITQTNAITLAPRDMGFRDMSVFTDSNNQQAFYVSGVSTRAINGPNIPPPSLLRTTDGVNFQAVPADPGTTMGNIQTLPSVPNACCFRTQMSYNGRFYVVVATYAGAGSVFTSADPGQGDNSFVQLTPPSIPVFEMQPFNGHLYFGVPSPDGYEVMRSDCTTPPAGQPWCPASSFTSVVPPGAGLGAAGSLGVTSMHVFTDTNGVPHLYVGSDSTKNRIGAEIIRINPDDSWDLVVGDPRTLPDGTVKAPLSTLKGGFGWPLNEHIWRMDDYNGVLYAGTFDYSIAYKYTAAYTTTTLAAQLQPYMGFDLWASADGVTFTPVTLNGFGDRLAFGARTLKATPYGLFVGSANWYQGLRIWQGALSPSALQLAPKNLQVDPMSRSGAVVLSWDAPRGSDVFHIYRATATRVALPPVAVQVSTPLPLTTAGGGPRTVWLPHAYSEIGVTRTPYFLDRTARATDHDSYYVVAQDAQGNLSAASNVVSADVLSLPTFPSLSTAVTALAARDKLSAMQVAAFHRTLQRAETRLLAGDVSGSRAALAALRRQIHAAGYGSIAGLYAENATYMLNRLEQRLGLVDAHVLSVSSVMPALTKRRSAGNALTVQSRPLRRRR